MGTTLRSENLNLNAMLRVFQQRHLREFYNGFIETPKGVLFSMTGPMFITMLYHGKNLRAKSIQLETTISLVWNQHFSAAR